MADNELARVITTLIALIAIGSLVTMFVGVLWFLIGTGLFPWWIAVGPAVIAGLIGTGLVLRMLNSRQ